MDATKIVGLSLLIPAAAMLAWRVRHTQKSREVRLGRVEIKVRPPRRFDAPMLASIATTVIGGGMLALERSGLLAHKH